MSGKQHQGQANHGPPVLLGSSAIKPPERKGLEKFTYMLYDPKAGTILTRTPKSWFLITVFYIILYSFLSGFWYGLLQIFLMNISLDEPRYILSQSLIGVNPGVGVRPTHHAEEVGTSIFALDLKFDGVAVGSEASTGSLGYATRLKNFLKPYEEKNPDGVDCSAVDDGEYHKATDTFCRFNLTTIGACGRFPYGYAPSGGKVSPCVLLKLNRIWGLKPEPIVEEADWPADATPAFKDRVMGTNDGKRIFVDCRGEYPADEEVLENGGIAYYPEDQGIPLKYFPFVNKAHTQNALVAVQFKDLPVGQLVHIECRAYYKGVVYSRKEKEGFVRFELLVSP